MKRLSFFGFGCVLAIALSIPPCAHAQSAAGPKIDSPAVAVPAISAAALSTTVTPGPLAASVWFEWGLDATYGNATPMAAMAGTDAQTVQVVIPGLTPYTTYHFQAYASNANGVVSSGDASFITVPKFVQAGTISNWTAAVLSGDGHELVATLNDVIYISTNFGGTFTPTAGTGSVAATSYDGSVILALSGANLIKSSDGGVSWATNGTPATFVCLSASTDGHTIVATDGNRSFYTTTSFGPPWDEVTVFYPPITHVASSSDGSYFYGDCIDYGTLYVYGVENRGRTWSIFNSIYGASNDGGIACSGDGSEVAVGTSGFWLSQDFCSSFTDLDPSPTNNLAVAVSQDGYTFVSSVGSAIEVAPYGGMVFYSATVVPAVSASHPFTSVMSSGDGSILAAFNGCIYISIPPVLLSAPTAAGGMLTFEVYGQAYSTYQVQVSSDLLNWSNLDAVSTGGDGTAQVSELTSTSSNCQFFRVVSQ